jgi:membrane-associated protease RseP (regulator of RpoE activity)
MPSEPYPIPAQPEASWKDRWAPPPPPIIRRRRRPLPPSVNLVCFLLTLLTTTIAGAVLTLGDPTWETMWDVATSPRYWTLGLPYSLCLVLILGTHEMGHYVACRLYGIDASLPFFLPAPPFFGTFGAVIRIRAPILNRKALFDIGVAGPIAGFVATVPVLLYGLAHSTWGVREAPRPGDIGLTPCLLLDLLYARFFPQVPNLSIRLHTVFVAGWIGLLATSLNLLPVGQLDGGHMLYALSRRLHAVVSRYGCLALIVGGMLVRGYHLVVFGVLFTLVGPGHPPLLDESEGLGAGRLAIAFLGLVIFLLCFIPSTPEVF